MEQDIEVDISRIPPGSESNAKSLMLMVTYACQFDCKYCEVARSKRSMETETAFRAIDLLFTTKSDNVLLRFFGGEPLLKFDLMRDAMLYSERLGREKNKKVRYMITTNGLLLDKEKMDFLSKFDVTIMLSMDGGYETHGKYRPLKNGANVYPRIKKNLDLLRKSGMNYFINFVIDPSNVGNLQTDLSHILSLGVRNIQLCYRVGVFWEKRQVDMVFDALFKFVDKAGVSGVEFQNFKSACEPVMLSQEIIVDTDGKVYFDAAIFIERKFPQLRNSYFIGDVRSLKSIDNLIKTKKELYSIFSSSLETEEQIKILVNNVNLGLMMSDFFIRHNIKIMKNNEHPIFKDFIRSDFVQQKKFLMKHQLGIDSVFLYLDSDCLNNCIFCRKKFGFYEPLDSIDKKLKNNMKANCNKIAIIGNEPLLHPEIFKIIKLCKKYGFNRVEIMTSGNCLADNKLVKELFSIGINIIFSLPLFGCDAKTHDSITQNPESFENVVRGIRNVKNYENLDLIIHTNLLKQNIKLMNSLEFFVKDLLKLKFSIFPTRPKDSVIHYKELMPTYKDMVCFLNVSSLVGFPLCITKNIQKKLIPKSEDISDSMKLYFLDQNFVKLKGCTDCTYYSKCSGTFRDYIKYYGSDDIKPF